MFRAAERIFRESAWQGLHCGRTWSATTRLCDHANINTTIVIQMPILCLFQRQTAEAFAASRICSRSPRFRQGVVEAEARAPRGLHAGRHSSRLPNTYLDIFVREIGGAGIISTRSLRWRSSRSARRGLSLTIPFALKLRPWYVPGTAARSSTTRCAPLFAGKINNKTG